MYVYVCVFLVCVAGGAVEGDDDIDMEGVVVVVQRHTEEWFYILYFLLHIYIILNSRVFN